MSVGVEPALILDDIANRLAQGVRDRGSPFHTPALATIGLDGAPRHRVVVLRAWDPHQPSLRVHTDSRSAKVAEIAADPRVSLLFYDPEAAIQVRVQGRATLHADDGLADGAWEASRRLSRLCYGQEPGPGAPLADADAFALPADDAAIAAGRAHFRAVSIAVEAMDWLHLRHGGHRRLRLSWSPGVSTPVAAGWIAP